MTSYFFRSIGEPVPNNTKFRAVPFKKRHEAKLGTTARQIMTLDGGWKTVAKIAGILLKFLPPPKIGADYMVTAYKPKDVQQWQTQLIADWQEQAFNMTVHPGTFPLDGPLSVQYWIFMGRPPSVNTLYPDKKPDEDNIIKVAQDSLEASKLKVSRGQFAKITPIIVNDSRIVDKHTSMRWAWMPYPDCGAQAPGIAVLIAQLDTSIRPNMNKAQKIFRSAGDSGQLGSDYLVKSEKTLQSIMEKNLTGWQYGEVPNRQMELIK